MIERILPDGVAAAELREFPTGLVPHPAEEPLIARAVEKRRRDFIGARHCARIALGKLGEPPAAILKGEKGQPLFPRGIVGSLTHCDGYQAAVLAHAMRYRSAAGSCFRCRRREPAAQRISRMSVASTRTSCSRPRGTG